MGLGRSDLYVPVLHTGAADDLQHHQRDAARAHGGLTARPRFPGTKTITIYTTIKK